MRKIIVIVFYFLIIGLEAQRYPMNLYSYDQVHKVSNSGYKIRKGNSYGFATLDGKIILEPIHDDILSASSKYIVVVNKSSQDIYDYQSKRITTTDLKNKVSPSNPYYAIQINDLWECYDDKNVKVRTLELEDILDFNIGYAKVLKDEHYGLVDSTFKITVEPIYKVLDYSGVEDYYYCSYFYNKGIIRSNGVLVYDPVFPNLKVLDSNLFLVKRNNVAIEGEMNIVLPSKIDGYYDSYYLINSKTLLFKYEYRKIYVINSKNEILLDQEYKYFSKLNENKFLLSYLDKTEIYADNKLDTTFFPIEETMKISNELVYLYLTNGNCLLNVKNNRLKSGFSYIDYNNPLNNAVIVSDSTKKYGVLDNNFNILIPIEQESYQFDTSGIIIFTKDRIQSILNSNLDTILTGYYSNIKQLNIGNFYFKTDSSSKIINLVRGEIKKFKNQPNVEYFPLSNKYAISKYDSTFVYNSEFTNEFKCKCSRLKILSDSIFVIYIFDSTFIITKENQIKYRGKFEIQDNKDFFALASYITNKFGAIMVNGELILKPEYDRLINHKVGIELVKGVKRGVYIYKSKKLIPPIYKSIDENLNTIRCEIFEGGEAIYNLNGELLADAVNSYDIRANRKYIRISSYPNNRIININSLKETQLNRYDLLEDEWPYYIKRTKYSLPSATLNGVVDEGHNVIIPLIYHDISKLIPRNYLVSLGNKSGILDYNNKFVLPLSYERILNHTYSNNAVYFTLKRDKKFGTINYKGEEILPFIYDSIGKVIFDKALAYKNNKWELINLLSRKVVVGNISIAIANEYTYVLGEIGNMKIYNILGECNSKINYDSINLNENNDWVVYKDGNGGLINKWGENVISHNYSRIISDYYGKLFIVVKNGKYGLIDSFENLVTKLIYDSISYEYSNYFLYKNNRVRVFDTKHRKISKNEYLYVEYYSNELIAHVNNGKYGLDDLNGKVIVENKYEHIWNMGNDIYFLVLPNSKIYGFTTSEFKKVVTNDYNEIYSDDKILCVKKGGKFGGINKAGKLVIPIIYDKQFHFLNEFAYVSLNGKKMMINLEGNCVSDCD